MSFYSLCTWLPFFVDLFDKSSSYYVRTLFKWERLLICLRVYRNQKIEFIPKFRLTSKQTNICRTEPAASQKGLYNNLVYSPGEFEIISDFEYML